MYPPTLLARAWPDPLDPGLPSPSIQPPPYPSQPPTTHSNPPQIPPRPLQETVPLPPDSPHAPDPTDLVDLDPSLSHGICPTALGLWTPTAHGSILILFGKAAGFPQAEIPIGWVTSMPAHPESLSPFSPSDHPFLVLFPDNAPRPPHHVPSHTLEWLACRLSGQIGRSSRRSYHSPNRFSLLPWVVSPPVSISKYILRLSLNRNNLLVYWLAGHQEHSSSPPYPHRSELRPFSVAAQGCYRFPGTFCEHSSRSPITELRIWIGP